MKTNTAQMNYRHFCDYIKPHRIQILETDFQSFLSNSRFKDILKTSLEELVFNH